MSAPTEQDEYCKERIPDNNDWINCDQPVVAERVDSRGRPTCAEHGHYITEIEAERVLKEYGTSGRQVVNQFIERLLHDRSQFKTQLTELQAKYERMEADITTALHAERERTRAEGWQPIETAPKTGEDILLGHGNSVWIDSWMENDHHGDCWMMCDQWTTPEVPTNWMPLPEPPRALEAAQLPQGE